ncbi:MAG: acyl-CoA thioesterase [Nocardioidaceae bacterium]|nr:acyl-CoA thioesterase [Nocardioidaceae bacterium]
MNNARYFELIDTCVNAFLTESTGVDIRGLPAVGVVAEVSCRYFREVGYPDPIDLGLAVERIGSSSVVYRIGIFQGPGDEAAAEGRFVHVYVDNTDPAGGRPSTPIPDVIRAELEKLSAQSQSPA